MASGATISMHPRVPLTEQVCVRMCGSPGHNNTSLSWRSPVFSGCLRRRWLKGNFKKQLAHLKMSLRADDIQRPCCGGESRPAHTLRVASVRSNEHSCRRHQCEIPGGYWEVCVGCGCGVAQTTGRKERRGEKGGRMEGTLKWTCCPCTLSLDGAFVTLNRLSITVRCSNELSIRTWISSACYNGICIGSD